VIGPLTAGGKEALIEKELEMAADGGLGHLENVAKFRDTELVALQDTEKAQAGGIREGIHPGEEGFGL